jgi:hypothetical protein
LRLCTITPLDRPVVELAMNAYLSILAPGVAKLDARPFFSGRRNIGWMTLDTGAIALFEARPGCLDAHLLCSPAYRGKLALRFGRAAVCAAFTYTDVRAITAEIPRDNKPSRLVCRAIGGIPFAESVDCFGRPCTRYILERRTWEASLAASPA